MKVHAWQGGPPPAWARQLGSPRLPEGVVQRVAVGPGGPVGGVVAWWMVDRWALVVERGAADPRVAALLARDAAVELDGELELVLADDHPAVPAPILEALGFRRHAALVGATRALRPASPPRDPALIPLSSLSPDARVACVAAVGAREDPPDVLWARLIAEAGSALDLDRWYAAVDDGAMVGVVLPQPDAVDPETGALAWIGVVPSARGRGWGARLLRAGLADLASRGVRRYEDLTDADNAAMLALFTRAGCATGERWTVWRRPREIGRAVRRRA